MKFLSDKRMLKIGRVARAAETALWCVFLAAIPLQARTMLFSIGRDWRFSEWRAVSLFGTDILMLGLMFLWVVVLVRGKTKFTWRAVDRWLLGFAGVSVVSGAYAIHSGVAWFANIKFIEGVCLYWYMREYVVKRFSLGLSLTAFVSGGIAQAVVAIGQFLKQGDIGLQWLGESVLFPALNGVAGFYTYAGEKFIRAYGLTPHPNVLAAVLLAVLVALGVLWNLHSLDARTNAAGNRNSRTWRMVGFIAAEIILCFGLFATFSRVAIFLATVLGVMVVILPALRRKFWVLILAAAFSAAAFCALFWPAVQSRAALSGSEEAVTLRAYYNRQAIESGAHARIIQQLIGIGPGNFTEWLMRTQPGQESWRYQPVHNVFLLVYVETGILGMIFFMAFLLSLIVPALKKVFRLAKKGFSSEGSSGTPPLAPIAVLILFAMLAFTALFDHFPWTLQQGRILWWGMLGLVAALGGLP